MRVVGVFDKPGPDFCGCGPKNWFASRVREKRTKRGPKFGWEVFLVCKKPVPVMNFLKNLLSPEEIINPTTDDLGLLPGADLMEPNDMNERGDIVGQALMFGGTEFHAFLAVGTRIYDLNDLVEPGSGILLDAALAINEAGDEILVTGSDRNSRRSRAVLLTIVPEPGAALGDLVAALLLCHRPRLQR